MGEGSTVPAAQWDWSPGVCSSQQEWAPPLHSSSGRRGISGEKALGTLGPCPAAGTPRGTAPLTLPNSGTRAEQRAGPRAISTLGLSEINPANNMGLLFRRVAENPGFVFFGRFQC